MIYNEIRTIMNTINMSSPKLSLENKIGFGSYGQIYKCSLLSQDHSNQPRNQEIAVKVLSWKKDKQMALREAVFMSTIDNPWCNSVIRTPYIDIHSQNIYLIQQLAKTDLRLFRKSNTILHDDLLVWTDCLLEAIEYLHQMGIIHGDIKASNILLYHDGTIKLTDYTLTILDGWNKKTVSPCTLDHKPIEVLMGWEWSYGVDIWALGCTLFYLLTGTILFVSQEKSASINALLEWHQKTSINKNNKTGVNKLKQRDVFYYSPRYPTLDIETNYREYLDCIYFILIVDPEYRPTIHQIINHINNLNTNEKSNSLVRCVDICSKTKDMIWLSDRKRIKVCKNINNLLTGYNNYTEHLPEIEVEIYKKINFKLIKIN